MTRMLVLYGTTEGHTAKVARALGESLRAQGADVDVIEAGSAAPAPDPYAGVIVAASVHAGGYQRPVKAWIRKYARALRTRPTAFVSVCLAVLQSEPTVQHEIAAIVDRFLLATGWQPTVTKLVAGALPYSKYNWLKRWLMTRIVRKAGGDTDTSRDYEYTDWVDLERFGKEFTERVAARENVNAA